jgi:hypothetical protein
VFEDLNGDFASVARHCQEVSQKHSETKLLPHGSNLGQETS